MQRKKKMSVSLFITEESQYSLNFYSPVEKRQHDKNIKMKCLTLTLFLFLQQFPKMLGWQIIKQRALKEMVRAKKKQKKETKSTMEHCSGRIINEWLRQILQGGTVGLFVLLLLHIKHINNRKGEVSRSSSKRNFIVIYCQNFPINMSSGKRLWITTKTKLKRGWQAEA